MVKISSIFVASNKTQTLIIGQNLAFPAILGSLNLMTPEIESVIDLTQTWVVPFFSIEICQTYFQIK